MIIAHMTYKQQNITVEVLAAWQQVDGRRVACVATLDGSKPFTQLTHGGPADTDSIVIRAEALRDVAIETGERLNKVQDDRRACELEALLINQERLP